MSLIKEEEGRIAELFKKFVIWKRANRGVKVFGMTKKMMEEAKFSIKAFLPLTGLAFAANYFFNNN